MCISNLVNHSFDREKHDKKVSLTALVWKPHSNDILYCDESGHVMMSTDVVANTTSADAESSQKTHDDGGKVLAGGDGQVNDLSHEATVTRRSIVIRGYDSRLDRRRPLRG